MGIGATIAMIKALAPATNPAEIEQLEEDVSELKSGLQGMTTATAGDVGKALSPKTVSDGKVTEWQFVQGGGGSVTIDDALFTSSTNPVQNKVITNALKVVQDKTQNTIQKSVNLMNTNDSDYTTGHYISGGELWENSSYNVTGYIPLTPGQTIVFSNNGGPVSARFVSVHTGTTMESYSSTKNNLYSYTNALQINLYVRISFLAIYTKFQAEYGNNVTSFVPYGAYYVVGLPEVQRTARTRIDIESTGNITDFDSEMQRAYNLGDCDVYIHRGTYQYTNTFIETLIGRTVRGIPIGNGNRYYFETGAKIEAKYTGSVNNYWYAFTTASLLGSYELHNLYLDSSKICYGIHDEYSGDRRQYRNLYDHCRIIVDNTGHSTSDSGYNKCIGGGLGGNAEIIIDGCYFDCVSSPTQDVSYHGQTGNNKGDNANIIVKDSWFRHTLALGGSTASSSEEKNVIFCNNSVTSDVYFPNSSDEPHWTLTKWNNEIRTA